MKLVYVLHQAHKHSNGCSSSVHSITYPTRDEAILHNKKEHRDYYEIDTVWVEEKSLNKLQEFVKKLFRM